MLKTILIVIAVVIAGILIFAATKPDTYRVERSIAIKAPPEKIYAILEDFDRAPEWSPYEKKDPNMKRTRSGAPKGKGAVYGFDGNKEVGAGQLQVIDVAPPNKLVIKLDMTRPMTASNTITYSMVPQGDSTTTTWAMEGAMPFVSKVMTVFFNMDKMIGADFEAGLAALKAVAEK